MAGAGEPPSAGAATSDAERAAEGEGELAGKVAIVTGGGRGLGRAIAEAYLGAGARVVVTAAREREEIDAVAASWGAGRALAVVADVTREDACDEVVARAAAAFGAVDVLVNNAGRGMKYVSDRFLDEPTRFWETAPDTWRLVIDTNVTGPFLMARAVVRWMLARGRGGSIVNVSMNYETMKRRGFSPYGPSKAALESASIIAGGVPRLRPVAPPHRAAHRRHRVETRRTGRPSGERRDRPVTPRAGGSAADRRGPALKAAPVGRATGERRDVTSRGHPAALGDGRRRAARPP